MKPRGWSGTGEFILRPTTDTWRESKRLRVGHLMELFRVVMDHRWRAGLNTLVRIDTVDAQHRRIVADLIDRW